MPFPGRWPTGNVPATRACASRSARDAGSRAGQAGRSSTRALPRTSFRWRDGFSAPSSGKPRSDWPSWPATAPCNSACIASMRPSHPSSSMPARHLNILERCDPARRGPYTGSDPEQARRLDVTSRILVAYLTEDPFGPRPLAPLLDRVRTALRGSEAQGQTDVRSRIPCRSQLEGTSLFDDRKGGCGRSSDRWRQRGPSEGPQAPCPTTEAIS